MQGWRFPDKCVDALPDFRQLDHVLLDENVQENGDHSSIRSDDLLCAVQFMLPTLGLRRAWSTSGQASAVMYGSSRQA